jgi:hypothetical protein
MDGGTMTTFVWVFLIVVGILVVVEGWIYTGREDRRQAGYQPKHPVDLDSVKMLRDDHND